MLYNDYCSEHYNNLYATNFPIFLNGKTSKNAITKAEQSAQRIAIKDTLKDALEKYSDKIETAEIWRAIYVAHLKRKSGLTSLDTLNEDIISKVRSKLEKSKWTCI